MAVNFRKYIFWKVEVLQVIIIVRNTKCDEVFTPTAIILSSSYSFNCQLSIDIFQNGIFGTVRTNVNEENGLVQRPLVFSGNVFISNFILFKIC